MKLKVYGTYLNITYLLIFWKIVVILILFTDDTDAFFSHESLEKLVEKILDILSNGFIWFISLS